MQAQAGGEAVQLDIPALAVVAVPGEPGLLVEPDLLPVLRDDGHLLREIEFREFRVEIAVVEDGVGADLRLGDGLQQGPAADEAVGIGRRRGRGRRSEIILQDRLVIGQIELGAGGKRREATEREDCQGSTPEKLE